MPTIVPSEGRWRAGRLRTAKATLVVPRAGSPRRIGTITWPHWKGRGKPRSQRRSRGPAAPTAADRNRTASKVGTTPRRNAFIADDPSLSGRPIATARPPAHPDRRLDRRRCPPPLRPRPALRARRRVDPRPDRQGRRRAALGGRGRRLPGERADLAGGPGLVRHPPRRPPPGPGPLPHGARLLRGRGRAQRLPAGEPRHLGDAA